MPVGLLVLPAWERLAAAVEHIDDAIALTATVWVLVAVRRGRPTAAAVLLAVAVDAKPWALAFVPVLLGLSAGRIRAAAVCAAVAVTMWLPFLIADPGTLAVTQYRILVSPSSVLRLIGVPDASTPAWCRPVQLALGLAAGLVLWLRRRLIAVVAAAVAIRLALDPGTWTYYTAGLVVGTAMLDVARRSRWSNVPWLTVAAVVLIQLPLTLQAQVDLSSPLRASLRAGCCGVVLLAAFTWRFRDLVTSLPLQAHACDERDRCHPQPPNPNHTACAEGNRLGIRVCANFAQSAPCKRSYGGTPRPGDDGRPNGGVVSTTRSDPWR